MKISNGFEHASVVDDAMDEFAAPRFAEERQRLPENVCVEPLAQSERAFVDEPRFHAKQDDVQTVQGGDHREHQHPEVIEPPRVGLAERRVDPALQEPRNEDLARGDTDGQRTECGEPEWARSDDRDDEPERGHHEPAVSRSNAARTSRGSAKRWTWVSPS